MSPTSRTTTRPDSLVMFINRAYSIHALNQKMLADIISHQDQQVMVRQKYTHKTLAHSKKKSEIHNSDGTILIGTMKNINRNVKDVISSWRYHGKLLTKEKIAFDDFINLEFQTFEDLIRLHTDYEKLMTKYSRVLSDEKESRDAVEVLLGNVEILQIAIGQIHLQTNDIVEPTDDDGIPPLMKSEPKRRPSLIKSASSRLKILKAIVPALHLDMNESEHKWRKEYMVRFDDCGTLSVKNNLSEHDGIIWAMEPFIMNEKQFLASGGIDKSIKIWNMSNHTVVSTLHGHNGAVFALASYHKDGRLMLASASHDCTIRLWDLVKSKLVATLWGHEFCVFSLAVYEKDGKKFLVSGSADDTIKVWDLTTNGVIATLKGHEDSVRRLCIYYCQNKPYLASGSYDCTVKIWNLSDHALITTLHDDLGEIYSIIVMDYDNKKILIAGDSDGVVTKWNLEDYKCLGYFDTFSINIWTLEALEWEDKACLVSAGIDNRIKIWNLESNFASTTLFNHYFTYTMRTFLINGRPCVASADDNGDIQIWME